MKISTVIAVGLTLAACATGAVGSASAESVLLTPSKDNTLFESATGSLSNGSGQYFFAGTTAGSDIRRGLLAFVIPDTVPTEATIESVTLTLWMSRSITGPQDCALHRLLTDWGEGASDAVGINGNEGSGAAAEEGDATWLHTFFDTDLWSAAGGDYDLIASAVESVGGVGSYTWSGDGMVTDVQSWLDDPATNFGWILIGNETTATTAKRFDTRENPTEENHPTLTIEYSLVTPTEESSWGSIKRLFR
jgi:hypothetical protein